MAGIEKIQLHMVAADVLPKLDFPMYLEKVYKPVIGYIAKLYYRIKDPNAVIFVKRTIEYNPETCRVQLKPGKEVYMSDGWILCCYDDVTIT